MIITSLTNPLIKKFNSLKEKKYRDEYKLFLVEGIDNIIEAKNNNIITDILYFGELDSSLKDLDVNYIEVNKQIIAKLSFNKSYGNVICVCKIINKEIKYDNFILALDGVQDPGNGGSLIRSSKAFNFNTVLVSKDSFDIYNDKFIKASKGYNFSSNLERCDLKDKLLQLKEEGYILVGADVHETASKLSEFKVNQKMVLVLGNEGNGLSKEIKDILDQYVYIEMKNNVESLNVAMAGSIIMYNISIRELC